MLHAPFLPRILALGLAALTFSSCDSTASNPSPQEGQTTPVPPTAPTSPIPGTPNPEPGFIAQPTGCNTANYYTEVIWEEQQPLMTLVQKPVAANGYQETTNLNRASATRTANADGSVTFGSNLEGGIIYTRVFPNGSCFIQSIATATGAVVFEENGRIQGSSSQNTAPPQPLPQRPVTDPVGPTTPPTQQRPVTDPLGPTTPPTQQRPVTDPPGPTTPPTQQRPVTDPPGPTIPPTQQRPVTDPSGPTTPNLQRPSVPEPTPPNLQR